MVKNYGQILKDIRQSKGLTLGEMTKRTGITNATISLIENEKVVPRPATIKKLSEAYEMDYIELYELLEKGE